jgi:Zn-dependent peptidase ImmA (M78 family)
MIQNATETSSRFSRCATMPMTIPTMAGADSMHGAKRAREARAALGIDPAAPLRCLLTTVEETVGVPVLVRALPNDIAGCYWQDGDRRLIHVNGGHGYVRQRFTLAHELGHAWCRHNGAVAVDSVQTIGGRTTNPIEIQANSFAAEFLVPRAGLEQVIKGEPDLDVLVTVAAHYRVSAIAVLFRFVTCELVGEARADRLRKEIDAGYHLDRQAELKPNVPKDRLARIAALPYLSPALAGSALAASLDGRASAGQVAALAGVSERALTPALEALDRR